jgi:hypothetical protein
MSTRVRLLNALVPRMTMTDAKPSAASSDDAEGVADASDVIVPHDEHGDALCDDFERFFVPEQHRARSVGCSSDVRHGVQQSERVRRG